MPHLQNFTNIYKTEWDAWSWYVCVETTYIIILVCEEVKKIKSVIRKMNEHAGRLIGNKQAYILDIYEWWKIS